MKKSGEGCILAALRFAKMFGVRFGGFLPCRGAGALHLGSRWRMCAAVECSWRGRGAVFFREAGQAAEVVQVLAVDAISDMIEVKTI